MPDKNSARAAKLSRAAKTTLGGVGTAGLSWLLLLGAIHVGLHVPSQESLSPLARLRALDYSLGDTGPFASLREEFVDEVLGSDAAGRTASSPARVTTEVASDVAPPRPPAPKVEAGRPPRTIVEHEFDNDHFEAAYPVDSIPFTASTETSSATRQPDEPPTCEPLAGGGTVWYRHRPTNDLGLIANTFGTTYAAGLAVYTGDGFGNLTQLGCDFDEGGNAQVVFPGARGTSYFFQVTSSGAGGHLAFSLDPLGRTRLASVSEDGKASDNLQAIAGSISANGRFVAFAGSGDNVVQDDRNACWWGACADIFVRDMKTGRNERVSVSSEGEPASAVAGDSTYPAISGDGRFVAFASGAPNLVPDDRNDAVDVFVHDRKTGRTERVSVSSDGNEGWLPESWHALCSAHDDQQQLQAALQHPDSGRWGEVCWFSLHNFGQGVSISSDGRYVAFSSHLHGLVPGVPPCTDTGGFDLHEFGGVAHPYLHPLVVPADVGVLSCRQIYVHDRKTGRTSLVAISSTGEAANADSSSPFVARTGRWVVFASDASNLAPVVSEEGRTSPDLNGRRDAFLHDLRTGTTELISLSSDEQQGIGDSGGHGVRGHVTVSDNGRWIAFVSTAPNLAPGDLNDEIDVFLRDRKSGQTVLVTPGPGESGHASISTNGRYIAITSPMDAEPLGMDHPQELLVYDRVTRTITRVSVATSGHDADGQYSLEPEISADGHYVVFQSDSSNFDPRDADPDFDVYVHELPWTR